MWVLILGGDAFLAYEKKLIQPFIERDGLNGGVVVIVQKKLQASSE